MINRQTLKRVFKENNSYTETAKIFGVSRQRIHQLITGYSTNNVDGDRKSFKDLLKKKCLICGKHKSTARHHKDFDNKNNVKSNLLNVCLKCHCNLHKEHRLEINYYRSKYTKCLLCGKKFTIEFKHYSLGKCLKCFYKTFHHSGWERFKNCEACGVVFDKLGVRYSNHFCKECHAIFKSNRDPKTIFKCVSCGKFYHPLRNWRLMYSKSHYCSNHGYKWLHKSTLDKKVGTMLRCVNDRYVRNSANNGYIPYSEAKHNCCT